MGIADGTSADSPSLQDTEPYDRLEITRRARS
jgi:hypothetical protein